MFVSLEILFTSIAKLVKIVSFPLSLCFKQSYRVLVVFTIDFTKNYVIVDKLTSISVRIYILAQ